MLKIIKKIFWFIVYSITLSYLVLFIPIFCGYNPLVILSGSMEPVLVTGGLFYYTRYDINKYEVGDILVYQMNNQNISHRIVEITDDGFITKGDANTVNDYYEVGYDQILGKGCNFCIPFIGYYADFISKNKFIFYILILLDIIDIFILGKKDET